jgi:hypothetical protein
VSLTNVTNAFLAKSQASATIIDDDFYTVLIQGSNVVEGNTGVTNAVFYVRLAPLASNAITVSYETADSTAIAGSDYLRRSGILFFPPGTATIPLSVPVLGDVRHETDESFFVVLSGMDGVLLSVNEATGRIINDDAEPMLMLLPPERIDGLWRVRFSSAAGKSYRLQHNDTLNPGSWTTVVDQIMGTGEVIEISDLTVPGSQSFYRVQVLP